MPTTRLFDQYPPFPTDVSTASTSCIPLGEIEEGNEAVSKAVFDACTEKGYFLLDLQTSAQGRLLLEAAEDMFDTANEIFDLGSDILTNYSADIPRSLHGFKRVGRIKTDHGKSDAIEFYTVDQDDITGVVSARDNPEPLQKRRGDCQTFIHRIYKVTEMVLSVLDKKLDLPNGTLISRCCITDQSTTAVRLLRAHPAGSDVIDNDDRPIKLGGHTDVGTITFVFNILGGLQVLPAGADKEEESWQYVKPQPGCVLVQIGDTLVEWTGGVLRSNLHRVLDPPGDQASLVRHSVAYLQRASDNASMKRLQGGSTIPPLPDGEEYETKSPSEWAVWRNIQIMQGKLKPQSNGGIHMGKPVLTSA